MEKGKKFKKKKKKKKNERSRHLNQHFYKQTDLLLPKTIQRNYTTEQIKGREEKKKKKNIYQNQINSQ